MLKALELSAPAVSSEASNLPATSPAWSSPKGEPVIWRQGRPSGEAAAGSGLARRGAEAGPGGEVMDGAARPGGGPVPQLALAAVAGGRPQLGRTEFAGDAGAGPVVPAVDVDEDGFDRALLFQSARQRSDQARPAHTPLRGHQGMGPSRTRPASAARSASRSKSLSPRPGWLQPSRAPSPVADKSDGSNVVGIAGHIHGRCGTAGIADRPTPAGHRVRSLGHRGTTYGRRPPLGTRSHDRKWRDRVRPAQAGHARPAHRPRTPRNAVPDQHRENPAGGERTSRPRPSRRRAGGIRHAARRCNRIGGRHHLVTPRLLRRNFSRRRLTVTRTAGIRGPQACPVELRHSFDIAAALGHAEMATTAIAIATVGVEASGILRRIRAVPVVPAVAAPRDDHPATRSEGGSRWSPAHP